MQVWIIEVRDRDSTRFGGWTMWHPLWSHLHRNSYSSHEAAGYAVRELRDTAPTGTQYRARRYDRREP